MSLYIVRSGAEGIVNGSVRELLRRACAASASPCLLVPSMDEAVGARKALADKLDPDLLGLAVSTPASWMEERWEVWGDGTRPVSSDVRTILAEQSFAETEALPLNPGTLDIVCRLAERSLPWLPLDEDGCPDPARIEEAGLTPAEGKALRIVGVYARLMRERGFCEPAQISVSIVDRLKAAGAALPVFVLSGFERLDRSMRTLVADVALASDVYFFIGERNAAADAGILAFAEMVADDVTERGGVVEREGVEGVPCRRAEELEAIRTCLFTGRCDVSPEGAVSLLHPAGPRAEAEIVAERCCALAEEGAREIVAVVPSPRAAWRELAPKLHARGLSCTADISCRLDRTEAGRAFIEFVQETARLEELDRGWADSVEEMNGTEWPNVALGSMDWWPPRGLSDFLFSDLSQMPLGKAQRLDAAWRGDRLLTPRAVLDALADEKKTSRPVAQAMAELEKGNAGAAAEKLMVPYVTKKERMDDVVSDGSGDAFISVTRPDDAAFDAEARGVLASIASLAATMEELGIPAGTKTGSSRSLADIAKILVLAMERTSMTLHLEAGAADASCEVRICDLASAARMQPASADAAILCGQTSVECAAKPSDDVFDAIVERLGIEPPDDAMQQLRSSFLSAFSVARTSVTLERVLNDADAKESYPSVMLTETMDCYGLSDESEDDIEEAQARGMKVTGRSERDISANQSLTGEVPAAAGSEPIPATGWMDEAARRHVVVTPEGMRGLAEERPLLSASQIEAYLECPYKWFVQRRLGLDTADAGFSNREMGILVHEGLCRTHEKLLAEALEEARQQGAAVPDIGSDVSLRLPHSRLVRTDAAHIEHAKEILSHELRSCMAELVESDGRAGDKPVPHTEEDRGRLRVLEKDLMSTLDFEAGIFEGFEPRAFEERFGAEGELVEYAGCYLRGAIDRVDVDGHGQAIVIDYKHRAPSSFLKEYAAFPEDGPADPFVLPRHVQALIYAQIVRRMHPEWRVVGALYLGTRGKHGLSGAVDENLLERVFGDIRFASTSSSMVSVPRSFVFGDASGMEGLLDQVEELIAERIQRMREGDIEAACLDKDACTYCPVLNCERRSR